MKTLLDPACHVRVLARLGGLSPDAPARWGRLSAPRRLVHLSDQVRSMLGDIQVAPIRGLLRWPLVKQAAMYWLPWPKETIKGPPEMFLTPPGEWNADLATFESLLDRFVGRTEDAIRIARAATKRKPDLATVWNGLGDVLLAAGRTAEAIDALKRGIALQPGYGPALERLELAHARLGELDLAAEIRASRLRLGGRRDRADRLDADLARLGTAEAMHQDLRRELDELLWEAEERDPFEPYYMTRTKADQLVVVYAALGEWHKAMDWVEHSYERRPVPAPPAHRASVRPPRAGRRSALRQAAARGRDGGPPVTRRAVLLALALVLCAAFPSAAQARTPLVQSIDLHVPAPPTPVTIAGRRHLAYELHLTNFRPFDAALGRVEVRDPDRRRSLADLRDAALVDRIGRPGSLPASADKRVLAGGMRAVVYLWLPLEDSVQVPTRLRHRIELDLVREQGRTPVVVEGGDVTVREEAPVVLDAPLRGGPWVALYDPVLARGHRASIYTVEGRARIPARYAIDFVRLDNGAAPARGDQNRIANWLGYGAEVLAVADAIVAQARDDSPEGETLEAARGSIPLENASGNFVTLDLGNGRYAFYEHLRHGSIRVKPRDRVRRGQVIGQLGNSGSSSSGPHLHFHVADANATLAAEGAPWVFRGFEVVGGFETIQAFAAGSPWKSVAASEGGARRLELPAPNVVVLFP